MELYHECVPDHAEVLREKVGWLNMDSASIVPGDILRIRPNQRVAADIRILEIEGGENCSFDTSSVTGIKEKKLCAVNATTENYFASPNMVFAGYLCVEGTCIGIVVATGKKTVLADMIKRKRWPPKKLR